MCCQVNWSHLENAYPTTLKISRTQRTVLSSGLFRYVFLFFQFAAFTTVFPFSCSTSFDFCCQYVSWFFFCLCTCVFGYFVLFFCFSLLLDICCVLEFPIFPTISHGKSKDGIQPFKGPKPAARIANSPENRAYWAACRGWHPPAPLTFPSLYHPPLFQRNNKRVCYLRPKTSRRLSTSLKNSKRKIKKINTNKKRDQTLCPYSSQSKMKKKLTL